MNGRAFINHILRKFASKLSPAIQQELKRYYYKIQIKNGNFKSREKEYHMLSHWISKGDYVIDVGANIGHYTMKLSELVGSNGRVFSIEPVPQTFEILASNVASGLYKNVTLLNFAASNIVCTAYMFIPKQNSGLENFYQASIVDRISETIIYCLPLDCIKFTERIKLIKIDIEGHELSALSGLKDLIKRDHPILIVEGNSKGVYNFLCDFGYSKIRIKNSPNSIFTSNIEELNLDKEFYKSKNSRCINKSVSDNLISKK